MTLKARLLAALECSSDAERTGKLGSAVSALLTGDAVEVATEALTGEVRNQESAPDTTENHADGRASHAE